MIESHDFDEDQPIPKYREEFFRQFGKYPEGAEGETQEILSFISSLLSELIESIPDVISGTDEQIMNELVSLKQSLKEKYL